MEYTKDVECETIGALKQTASLAMAVFVYGGPTPYQIRTSNPLK